MSTPMSKLGGTRQNLFSLHSEKCKLRLWLPEYHSMDIKFVEVQGENSPLTLCKCVENDQPGYKISANQRTFSSKLDAAVLPHSSIPEIGTIKPDHIIGFQKSPSLDAALQMHSDLESSPGGNANHIKFPFLVLEAKSETQSCGFRAVEKQTAFPIKRLVDIQKNLREMGKESTERALVWFLAYIGDEWRRIIDLWHGSILKRDEALQLCIIIDLICDWAWDILHRDIIRLLSKGHKTILNKPTTKEYDQGYAPSPSKRETIIRNASEVFFSFRHLELPESSRELAEILESPSLGDKNITANAIKLLDLFNLKQPLLLPRSFISELEKMWTCASNKYPLLHSDMLSFAHISFQSYFRPSDFHTVREISCITASRGAIRVLEQMIGRTTRDSSCLLDISISVRLEDVLPLATGSGQDSIRAAARNLHLALRTMPKSMIIWKDFLEVDQVLKCKWEQAYYQGEYVSSFWNNIDSRSPGNPLLLKLRRCSERRSSELRTLSIANEFSYKTIRELLGGKKGDFPYGAVILKIPTQSLHPLNPQYCLAVFDGYNLDDRSALGKKLSQLIQKGRLFEGNSRKEITNQDHQILHDWETRLRGNNGLST
ncbi:hypothetical protein N7507_003242 [Penicillium longicatenatum]|nr:hypothetical protein N7507_003242 [Penicillium longicatenatum]